MGRTASTNFMKAYQINIDQINCYLYVHVSLVAIFSQYYILNTLLAAYLVDVYVQEKRITVVQFRFDMVNA